MHDLPAHHLVPDALTPEQIESKAENVAISKANMPLVKLFVLAMFAGAFVALGAAFFTVVMGDREMGYAAQRALGGLCFCLGLELVLLCGAELFTGNALMVLGKASGKISGWGLVRNWSIVWCGNFVGAVAIAALVFLANLQGLGAGAVGEAMVELAVGKVTPAWHTLFFKGVLCNLLVCLAVWIGFGARSTADKVLGIILPVSAFVVMGFEHCVANMFFLPMGLAAKAAGFGAGVAGVEALDAASLVHNLSAATLGNVAGGILIVGVGYWIAYGREAHKREAEAGNLAE
ncbi:MAG: formate/nitrite transporter family protein [Collinsella sp.]|nr:formate/nitrite transporter family protein [Collinsella sp.]